MHRGDRRVIYARSLFNYQLGRGRARVHEGKETVMVFIPRGLTGSVQLSGGADRINGDTPNPPSNQRGQPGTDRIGPYILRLFGGTVKGKKPAAIKGALPLSPLGHPEEHSG
jgi:hypothetical protein